MLLFQESQKSFWNTLPKVMDKSYDTLFEPGQASAVEGEGLRDTCNNDDFREGEKKMKNICTKQRVKF